MALTLEGYSLRDIGRLLKYVPNRWGVRRLKPLSIARVQQIKHQALKHISLMLLYTVRHDLAYIESSIMELRARKAYYDKINSNLDDCRADQPIEIKQK